MESRKNSLAYFVTFRCYGTWLHGDKRGSTSRFRNIFRTPHHRPNKAWQKQITNQLKHSAFQLGTEPRRVVARSIEETCEIRRWSLHAVNVRTNHVHVVIGAGDIEAKKALGALKANATRALRARNLCDQDRSPWSRGGSVRYIWDISALGSVVDYVLYDQ